VPWPIFLMSWLSTSKSIGGFRSRVVLLSVPILKGGRWFSFQCCVCRCPSLATSIAQTLERPLGEHQARLPPYPVDLEVQVSSSMARCTYRRLSCHVPSTLPICFLQQMHTIRQWQSSDLSAHPTSGCRLKYRPKLNQSSTRIGSLVADWCRSFEAPWLFV
jgi:hypothetical protein